MRLFSEGSSSTFNPVEDYKCVNLQKVYFFG